MTCDHSGAHSGATRYLRRASCLRLVLVCDECGAECGELGTLEYRPEPVSQGAAAGTERAAAAARGPAASA